MDWGSLWAWAKELLPWGLALGTTVAWVRGEMRHAEDRKTAKEQLAIQREHVEIARTQATSAEKQSAAFQSLVDGLQRELEALDDRVADCEQAVEGPQGTAARKARGRRPRMRAPGASVPSVATSQARIDKARAEQEKLALKREALELRQRELEERQAKRTLKTLGALWRHFQGN